MRHTIIYIAAPALDDARSLNTLLIEARRAYFSDPDGAQRVRHTNSDETVCTYHFRKGSLQWRVTQGIKTLQREHKTKNGYLIRPSRTRTDYFDPDHHLLRVEYAAGDRIEVRPDNALEFIRVNPENGQPQQETLFPCPCVPADGATHQRYIRVLGTPQALLYTTDGVLCCYNTELARLADELKIQFAAEDRTPEPQPEPQPVTEPEASGAAPKRRLACGRIQKGQFIINETPVQGSLTFDDHSSYEGEMVQNLPHGSGTMTDADGAIVYQGQWRAGKRHGSGTSYDENGVAVYSGVWEANQYHGQGVLRLPDGSTLTGRFNMGTVIGPVTHRNAAGQMIYEGRMENGLPHGNGALYRNGELMSEGTFRAGKLNGSGKLYNGGQLVYVGEVRDDVRWGVGASLEHGAPSYFGQWEADEPHGAGMQYKDRQLEFVGQFSRGCPDGRVDQYKDGRLYRELQLRRGMAVYMIEYEDGHPVYIGRVKNGVRHGAGRLLDEYGQCVAQGIFKDGVLYGKMRVVPRPMPPLDCPPELRTTPYEQTACRPERYVLNLAWEGGIYSGCTRDGRPHGLGSLIYPDHTFAGVFCDGVPNGEGMLTQGHGKSITGTFAPDGTETIACRTVSYQIKRS